MLMCLLAAGLPTPATSVTASPTASGQQQRDGGGGHHDTDTTTSAAVVSSCRQNPEPNSREGGAIGRTQGLPIADLMSLRNAQPWVLVS
jgi:hypothetical protein